MNKKLKNWLLNSGSSFSPLSLSPIAWYDNGSDYMASDGTSWIDRIAASNLSGVSTFTANAQNSKPSLAFNGTAQTLDGAIAIKNIPALTIWQVGKRSSFTNFSISQLRTEFFHGTDDNIYCVVSNGVLAYGQFAHTNTFNYSLMIYDGTQSTNATKLILYVNGVARTLSFTSTIPTTTQNSTDNISMGINGAVNEAGQSLEIGFVTRAITANEIANLNSYLATKYGL